MVPNLHDKKKYVIHVKTLKQALDNGLVLEKIHGVIQFKQSVWMKEYIDFNTRLRMVAKNDFEKDFYKLMNNSVFGKMMDNIRKHRDIKLVNNKEDYLKQVMKPNFKGGVLMGADLMSCEMGKVKVKMNKPVYLGQAILDLSKTIMYEFHYDYMKRKYKESDLKLFYMDTDCRSTILKLKISTKTKRKMLKLDLIQVDMCLEGLYRLKRIKRLLD